MSMLKDYRSSIEELTATTPKKKAALIRSLLPTIEAALRSGQTLKDIWETLRNQGLNMGYHVFQMTLWRARKSKAGTAPGGWEKGTKPSDSLDPQERDVPDIGGSRSICQYQAAGSKQAWVSLARNAPKDCAGKRNGGIK